MIDVLFEIPIEPIGKARARVVRTKNGASRSFTPAKTVRWEQDVSLAARQAMPNEIIDEPLRVDVLAVRPRPRALLRKADPDGLIWCPKKPDGDNIRKAVLDALSTYWRDDALVVSGDTVKAYAERHGRSRVVVRIRSVTETPEAYLRQLGFAF